MQAWNWAPQATQATASYASPQAFPGGQVPQVYQSGQVAQAYQGGQIPQAFQGAQVASNLVPGQQMMTNYQQFYGGAMPTTTAEVPAGYTPQQWEAAQQQHFMQWQQWNQQYQQWQQDYGNTYSMAVQGGPPVVPPPSVVGAEPPPLPPPDKPPPPPEESRSQQPEPPNFQNPPPEIAASFKGQKRPTDDDQSKFQGPADKKQRGDNFQQFGRGSEGGRSGRWGPATEAEAPKDEEEDRSEQEKSFDAQFLLWEEEFKNWKDQNINHPDKTQYNEYETKWTKWRQELLHRREQMRKKRLSGMTKGTPEAAVSKGRAKGDRAPFTDTKSPSRNHGNEFHDNSKQPGNFGNDPSSGLHQEGFGYQQPQIVGPPKDQGGFPSNGKPEIKSLLDLPLQFTGQYAKKGYGVEKDDSKTTEAGGFVESQKSQASNAQQHGDQKGFTKTSNNRGLYFDSAHNFQGPQQPKINFNFNKAGSNNQQLENANSASQPVFGPQVKPGGPPGTSQNKGPEGDAANMGLQVQPPAPCNSSFVLEMPKSFQTNEDFSEDVQLDKVTASNEHVADNSTVKVKPLLQTSDIAKENEVIDITKEQEPPNYDFLKKSNVIPGLDLFSDKPAEGQKKGIDSRTEPNANGRAQFSQDPHFDSRIQTSQGHGFEFPKGPGKPTGQGLMPTPSFGNDPNFNQWSGNEGGQQGFRMNQGPGFQGNMPGFGPFGPTGPPGNTPGNQSQYFGSGNQSQNVGPGNEGPNSGSRNQGPNLGPRNENPNVGPGNHNQNFGPGNQGPYNMGPRNNGPNMGPGNQNPNFGSGNMGPNFTSPGNKGPNMGPGNQTQNFGQGGMGPNFTSPGNKGPNMGTGNQSQNFGQSSMGANFSMSPGNKGPNVGTGNQNPTFGPGNMGPNMSPGNKDPNMLSGNNQNFGAGNMGQNFSPSNKGPPNLVPPLLQPPNFGPGGPNMGTGNQRSSFGTSNMGPNINKGNTGPNFGSSNQNTNFGPGNPGPNFGPGNQGPNFGPGNQGPNFGPGNQGPNFGPGNQGGPHFGPGNKGPNFVPLDQMNRNNQGFGNQNFGPKGGDHSGFIRDQVQQPRGPHENQDFPGGGLGSAPRNWEENQEGRNQGPREGNFPGHGPSNWNDNADWDQGGNGRDLHHPGPPRDMNQGTRDNFPPDNIPDLRDLNHRPGNKFPGGPVSQFPPKDGFPDKGGPAGSFPVNRDQFPKEGLSQDIRGNFPGQQENFEGSRDGFSKEGPIFPGDGANCPGPRDGFPKDTPDFPGIRDRGPNDGPNYMGSRDGFPKEGPNFRGPRDRFPGDRDAYPGPVDSQGTTREPFPNDRFPHDVRGNFPRDRFQGRDRFDSVDGARGYPDREFDRDPFRDDFRGRDDGYHGERNRNMEFDDRGNSFFAREHGLAARDFEVFGRGRGNERGGWSQRGGGRPPHDYYRAQRQFDDREGDPYSLWDRAQRPPTWDNAFELEPATIVEYGHKPAPPVPLLSGDSAATASKSLEPVQTFDYGHGAAPTRHARDVTHSPPSEPWRRDEYYGRHDRELSREHQDRDKRSYEREGRWDRERERERGRREDDDRPSKYGADEDRFRSRTDDRWSSRRGGDRDSDRDRNGRARDNKRDGDSGRSSKSGPPPTAPPPPSFTGPSDAGKGDSGTDMTTAPSGAILPAQRPILVEDLLSPPGRDTRPQRIVVILRGPPGSGKTFVAKLIKDKEVEMGGSPPRILCLDDYFMVEVEKEEQDPESGRKVKVKAMEFEYEAGMEKHYRSSLVKAFKKTVNENYFPFIIVDCVNQEVKHFEEMWSYAKQKGFQVYICEMDMDVSSCMKRNTHNRTEKEIADIVKAWEETPKYYLRLDVRSLLQSVAITEVEMEDSNPNEEEEKKEEKEQKAEEEGNEADEDNSVCVSKWERMEPSGDKLDRLDGLRRRKLEDKPKTLEDWLQLSDDYDKRETKPGQKRVRWADLEEKREQEKMRAIGFVVGQTDWSRMTDPTFGESALTQTKYI